jgi:hypothetical protein
MTRWGVRVRRCRDFLATGMAITVAPIDPSSHQRRLARSAASGRGAPPSRRRPATSSKLLARARIGTVRGSGCRRAVLCRGERLALADHVVRAVLQRSLQRRPMARTRGKPLNAATWRAPGHEAAPRGARRPEPRWRRPYAPAWRLAKVSRSAKRIGVGNGTVQRIKAEMAA